MKYKICPLCGSALDHGERCDCERAVGPDDPEARRPIRRKRPNYDDLYARHLGIDRKEHMQ